VEKKTQKQKASSVRKSINISEGKRERKKGDADKKCFEKKKQPGLKKKKESRR